MTINPVYRREMKVSSRSIRLPIILAVFNFILAAFALISMATTVNMARETAQLDYAAFLQIFAFVAVIEFALIIMVQPALTAGSISGERERRTLDLMLTTRLTPAKIVTGKLLTSLSNVVVVLASSLPILAMVFAYGGVTVMNIAVLMISFLTAALLTASIGLLASSFCKRSSMATALAYAGVLVLMGGTLGFCILGCNIMGSSGNAIYILLANPASTFYCAVCAMLGYRSGVQDMASMLCTSTAMSITAWFILGTVIQLILSLVFLLISVRNIGPDRKV